ncbi:hypothetical protein SDC9_125006 [bioreactor metagenome]|uniref:Uncharacterized protein n=1 Tax=bioreactor metagenome TaxID=1076179 RepID=A0A645CLV3_9ZZZZ
MEVGQRQGLNRLIFDFEQQPVAGDPGVVDQYIEASLFGDLGKHRLDRRFVAHVATMGDDSGVGTGTLAQSLHRLPVDVAAVDDRSGGGQFKGDPAPQTAAGAGDQTTFIFNIHKAFPQY